MEFNVNHPIIFIIVGIILSLVIAQSVFFLVRAIKRAKELGVTSETIKKTITGSAVFTIAPAIAIVIGVITLSQSLGLALPWFRLSVVGSLSYEAIAANTALQALGLNNSTTITDPNAFVTVVFVMTSGIISGTLLVPLLCKKVHKGLMNYQDKDKKWGEIFNNAMFLGMISAFLGYVFCDVTAVFKGETYGLVAPIVMIISAAIIAIIGILGKKPKLKWLMDYALPISLICGMAAAIPLTMWLGAAA